MKDDPPTRQSAVAPKEYAERMGVSLKTVYRWLRSGELPGRKIGGSWRIPASALAFDTDAGHQTTGEAA